MQQMPTEKRRIAIVGGGVAGATAAVHMAELGLDVCLIEKGSGLVNGPPICHLHAGGNLYREISEQQCTELLRQSIETVRLFPHTLNKRPTVIAVPRTDPGSPESLLPRLQRIRESYQALIDRDPANKILGEPGEYFRLYSHEELQALSDQKQPGFPESMDEWLIPFAQHTDLSPLKYPVIAVQEYGWSVFRLAASAEMTLKAIPNCTLMTNTSLKAAGRTPEGWHLVCEDKHQRQRSLMVDYLINACGYETGRLDDLTLSARQRLVEFKAAYVTHWPDCTQAWPEVIFHGERGTPRGMAQLTPYADGVFQLHGMTEGITLFTNGLAASGNTSSQPELPPEFMHRLNQGWSDDEIQQRTIRAVRHIAQYMPEYSSATVHSKPLFGAQQIPGNDATLRVADVSFEADNYARIEIVKGSSALEAASKIVRHWQLVEADRYCQSIESLHPVASTLKSEAVEQRGIELAEERMYPAALARRVGEF